VLGRVGPTRAAWPPDIRPAIARLVVASVRPTRPNADVIAVAADAARAHDAHLLVLGTIRPVPVDYTQVSQLPTLLPADAGAELFADIVELLWYRDVPWSVQVVMGHPARRINQLARRCELRTVVTGHSSRRREWWRKIGDQTRVVVTP
jgi:nucleotide-binding universal stress UspA family protein